MLDWQALQHDFSDPRSCTKQQKVRDTTDIGPQLISGHMTGSCCCHSQPHWIQPWKMIQTPNSAAGRRIFPAKEPGRSPKSIGPKSRSPRLPQHDLSIERMSKDPVELLALFFQRNWLGTWDMSLTCPKIIQSIQTSDQVLRCSSAYLVSIENKLSESCLDLFTLALFDISAKRRRSGVVRRLPCAVVKSRRTRRAAKRLVL